MQGPMNVKKDSKVIDDLATVQFIHGSSILTLQTPS